MRSPMRNTDTKSGQCAASSSRSSTSVSVRAKTLATTFSRKSETSHATIAERSATASSWSHGLSA